MADNKFSWQVSQNQAKVGVPFNPSKHNISGWAAGNAVKTPIVATRKVAPAPPKR